MSKMLSAGCDSTMASGDKVVIGNSQELGSCDKLTTPVPPKQQQGLLAVPLSVHGGDHEDAHAVLERELSLDSGEDVTIGTTASTGPGCDDTTSHYEMSQKLAYYQRKARDSKRMILRLKCQKDNELQAVTTQLLVLESHLRREQKMIQSQLVQRDHIIQEQSQEIEKLRRGNRRLINRLKKFSEVFGDTESENLEPRSKMGRLDSIEEDQYLSTDRSGCISPTLMLLTSSSQFPFTLPSKNRYQVINNNEKSIFPVQISNSLSNSNKCVEHPNNFQQDIVNPDILNIRATTDRVSPKQANTEKIRASPPHTRTVPHSGNSSTPEVHTPHKKTCSIVSTISRLLDEESDCTATAGSSNSEPSSPEATVKTVPPRVIRLARKLKESLTSSNLALRLQNSPLVIDTSLESPRHEEHDHTSYLSDEHEVTSGYNSDAVSDPDYDSLRRCSSKKYEDEDEESRMRHCTQINSPQHAAKDKDSTIEQPRGPQPHQQKDITSEPDGSNNSTQHLNDALISESIMSVRNVPRSRQNIKFIIDNNTDHMNENFEEFTLDSLENEENHQSENVQPDSTCRDKENIHENPNPVADNNGGDKDLTEKENGRSPKCFPKIAAVRGDMMNTKQYETFLESSNFIQKSILTPTRSLINHRSMLKPRDIKHRNKLRMVCTTLSSLEENPITGHKYYVKL